MVAIQFTNRFFGFQPKVRERGQFLQYLRPELLGVFAAGVKVPCKLVEVASHLAALGRQGGKRRQCILAALRHHNGVLDVQKIQTESWYDKDDICCRNTFYYNECAGFSAKAACRIT